MRFFVLAAVLAASACVDDDATNPSRHSGDPMRGRFAFVQDCSTCHASNDGMDLATFRFSDTTIIRRAVAHVDTATALDIVAHIRTLSAKPLTRETRIFQPGEYTVAGDVEFAFHLFGSDAWPEISTAALRMIDPRKVRIAIQMPAWSDERSNLDWMPDMPVPAAILDDQGSLARAAVAGYQAAPSRENLIRAVSALRSADRRMTSAAAPCLLEDSTRVDYMTCFQVRRWTSSLVAQHMIRYGIDSTIDPTLHDVWWDVGNAARKSIQRGQSVIANAKQNWAEWMYLSWSFDPSRHPSVYTGGGLMNVGLPRHATFVALRSQVARPAKTSTPYADLHSAVNFAPTSWAPRVASFGYTHLLERLTAGDRPRIESLAMAREDVGRAWATLQRKLTSSQLAAIRPLHDQVLVQLQ